LNALDYMKNRESDNDCDIVLPLVGEFNAGKTTLINSLTDAKQLETAYTPTTSSVFEVHFGHSRCCATIYYRDGRVQNVEQIDSIRNQELKDILVVATYDTSTRIPSSAVLVDTPGLSSPNKQHEESLLNFMPNADAIFYLVDVHSQITTSALNFVKRMAYNTKPIYLIITKKEEKSLSEIGAMKNHIQKEFPNTFKRIATVSAKKDDISEFLAIIDEIQQNKKQIIATSNKNRCEIIKQSIVKYIDDIVCHTDSDTTINRRMQEGQAELVSTNKSIKNFMSNVEFDIQEISREITRKFEDLIFERLDYIVATKSGDYNLDAISAINTLSISLINEYKAKVLKSLRGSAQNDDFARNALLISRELDLPELDVHKFGLNMDLNSMGHDYDSKIATGVKFLATVAVVAATGIAVDDYYDGSELTSGETLSDVASSAVPSISEATGSLASVPKVGNVLISNQNAQIIGQATQFFDNASAQYERLNQLNQEIGCKLGEERGIVEGIVSLLTDRYIAKAQRRNAVRNYIENALSPEFKILIDRNTSIITNHIHTILSKSYEEKNSNLKVIREQHKTQHEEWVAKVDKLNRYKQLLLASL